MEALITRGMLYDLKAAGADIALVTRSPRRYAQILVNHFYPGIDWKCIVAFEDVSRTKPDPEAYRTAANIAGVADPARVLVIGDGKEDISAAYSAGFFVGLYMAGWGKEWRQSGQPDRAQRYAAIDLLADAVLEKPRDILGVLFEPEKFSHRAEACLEPGHVSPTHRVEAVNHFNNLIDARPPENMVRCTVLGRYFSTNSSYGEKRSRHALTRALLTAKDTGLYSSALQGSLVSYLLAMANAHAWLLDQPMIVCPIPARPGRKARVESLLANLADDPAAGKVIEVRNGLLTFRDGVQPNKNLDKAARFSNIRDNLMLNGPESVKSRYVIVVDDIVTSGATFFYARQLLLSAGSPSVSCLALAQTVR